MYLTARGWGIQPSEFWAMTIGEYILEASYHYSQSPEYQAAQKREQWMQDAELTDEEWKAKYGTPKN